MASDSEWLAKGREIQGRLWGQRVSSGASGPPGMQLAPEFFEWVAQACFGREVRLRQELGAIGLVREILLQLVPDDRVALDPGQ